MAEKYNMYKNIFSGLRHQDDVDFFVNKCPKEDIEIITSINNSYCPIDVYSMLNIKNFLENVQNYKYREELEDILNGTSFDKIQQSITESILNSKPPKPIQCKKILLKKCPHCNYPSSAPEDTSYIVCGVDVRGKVGLDYNGCLKDWCFKCGKKLCKDWNNDYLFVEMNRRHNEKCCRTHAKKNGFKYPDDYCMCISR